MVGLDQLKEEKLKKRLKLKLKGLRKTKEELTKYLYGYTATHDIGVSRQAAMDSLLGIVQNERQWQRFYQQPAPGVSTGNSWTRTWMVPAPPSEAQRRAEEQLGLAEIYNSIPTEDNE